jgi:hypothetical protein
MKIDVEVVSRYNGIVTYMVFLNGDIANIIASTEEEIEEMFE